jgi:hypothetical protein
VRSDGAVRADNNCRGVAIEGFDPVTGNAELGLRATPEQIRGSGRDDEKIFVEACEPYGDLVRRELFHKGVDEQYLVSGGAQHFPRREEFEREVRLGAAEVG